MLSRMAWWLTSFWSPFWRFLVWGNSKSEGFKKVLTLIVAVGAPYIASTWESPAYLYLYAFHREIISTPVRFGVLISAVITIIWIILAAGRAIELTGIPKLKVSKSLKDDQDFFRMYMVSEKKDFETTVWLMGVYNADGKSLLPGRFPLELEGTHKPGESSISLRKGIPASVVVAEIRRSNTGQVSVLFGRGAKHHCAIIFSRGKSVYFHLNVDYSPLAPIERWFRFERIDEAEFKAYSVDTPPFTPQAIL